MTITLRLILLISSRVELSRETFLGPLSLFLNLRTELLANLLGLDRLDLVFTRSREPDHVFLGRHCLSVLLLARILEHSHLLFLYSRVFAERAITVITRLIIVP